MILTRTHFRLPDWVRSSPFPFHENPHIAPLADESNAWISTYGIHPNDAHRQAYEACNFGLLVSATYPHATVERTRILCDFINALFSFDDLMDEEDYVGDVGGSKGIMDQAMNALWHPETYKTEHRVSEALQNFWRRAIEVGCAQGTQRRFLEYMDHYCRAVLLQTKNRAQKHIMDVESFVRMRRDTGALKICFVMGEFGLNLDLPDSVFDHPLIKTMENCANDVVVLSNDAYSWNIEQAQGHTANIVTCLMNQNKINVQAAMNIVDGEVQKRFQLYQDCKAKLPSWGEAVDAQILAYATVLEDWMTGNFTWSLTSMRYFGKNAPAVRKSLQVKILPREFKTATDLRNEEESTKASSEVTLSSKPPSSAVAVLSKRTQTIFLWYSIWLTVTSSFFFAFMHYTDRLPSLRAPSFAA